MEIWKDIEEYNGDYQVSNLGRIKSLKFRKEKILKSRKSNNRYFYIRLWKNRKSKNKYIHDLMFETFNNYKLKSDECVHHINKNKSDNNLDNFQLMTNSEHMNLHNSGENHPMYGKNHSEETKKLMREKRIGKHLSEKTKKLMSEKRIGKHGEKSSNHKLFERDIIQIRKLCDEGILTQTEIGKLFGVSHQTISLIKNRKIWKNI